MPYNLNVILSITTIQILILSILLGLITLGFFVFSRRQKTKNQDQLRTTKDQTIPESEAVEKKQTETNKETKAETSIEIEELKTPELRNTNANEVQSLFEDFVNTCLARAGFHIDDTSSNEHPGLSIYSNPENSSTIAVSCRWQPGFVKGRLEWAKSYELVRYREFENNSGIRVFAVVGIAGDPAEPECISFTPVKEIKSNVLLQSKIELLNARDELRFESQRMAFKGSMTNQVSQ